MPTPADTDTTNLRITQSGSAFTSFSCFIGNGAKFILLFERLEESAVNAKLLSFLP